jgi:Xaa-Pro aminopeptidase
VPSERHLLCVVPARGDPRLLIPKLSRSRVRQSPGSGTSAFGATATTPQATLGDAIADCDREPGRVLLDGEVGVRVEDLIAVTETGCERVNDSPRGWRVGG